MLRPKKNFLMVRPLPFPPLSGLTTKKKNFFCDNLFSFLSNNRVKNKYAVNICIPSLSLSRSLNTIFCSIILMTFEMISPCYVHNFGIMDIECNNHNKSGHLLRQRTKRSYIYISHSFSMNFFSLGSDRSEGGGVCRVYVIWRKYIKTKIQRLYEPK